MVFDARGIDEVTEREGQKEKWRRNPRSKALGESIVYEKKEDSSKEPTEKQLQSKRKTQVWCTQNPAEESNLCRRSSQVYLKLCRCQIRERKRCDHRSQHRECWRTIQGQSQWRGGDRRSVQWGWSSALQKSHWGHFTKAQSRVIEK